MPHSYLQEWVYNCSIYIHTQWSQYELVSRYFVYQVNLNNYVYTYCTCGTDLKSKSLESSSSLKCSMLSASFNYSCSQGCMHDYQCVQVWICVSVHAHVCMCDSVYTSVSSWTCLYPPDLLLRSQSVSVYTACCPLPLLELACRLCSTGAKALLMAPLTAFSQTFSFLGRTSPRPSMWPDDKLRCTGHFWRERVPN